MLTLTLIWLGVAVLLMFFGTTEERGSMFACLLMSALLVLIVIGIAALAGFLFWVGLP